MCEVAHSCTFIDLYFHNPEEDILILQPPTVLLQNPSQASLLHRYKITSPAPQPRVPVSPGTSPHTVTHTLCSSSSSSYMSLSTRLAFRTFNLDLSSPNHLKSWLSTFKSRLKTFVFHQSDLLLKADAHTDQPSALTSHSCRSWPQQKSPPSTGAHTVERSAGR